jgi:cytochrome c oxidase assembly factor CtaG
VPGPAQDIAVVLAARAPDAPSLGDLALDWSVHPALSAALLANALAYLGALVRLSRVGSPWPHRRAACFVGGLVVLSASLQSGLDTFAADLLSAHMAQHLLLTLVVPPLLLLGAPVTLALRALPRTARRALGAALTGAVARVVTNPVVSWPIFTAVMVGSHFSPLYEAAVTTPAVHAVEHALYLGAGLVFWVPVVGADPVPRPRQPAVRLLYLMLAMPPMALVGVALASAGAVRYPSYLEPAQALAISALADQHDAGMMMWLGGSAVLAAATVAVGWHALVREERRQAVRERHAVASRVTADGGERPALAPMRGDAGRSTASDGAAESDGAALVAGARGSALGRDARRPRPAGAVPPPTAEGARR